jgi:L-amino acid N-acyltransferase YncA
MMSNSPVGVRVATADDLRFVASTWFRSVLESNTVVNQLPFGVFRDGMEANIQRLIKRSTVRVVFATSQPDELLGYVVLEHCKDVRMGVNEPVCHHVYVKSAFRRQGIGRSLIGETKVLTHPATPGAGKKFAVALGLLYNPRLG